ncbi:MAG TPA: hypothetical protein VH396_13475, partial [Chitinophagaceae bacterium]
PGIMTAYSYLKANIIRYFIHAFLILDENIPYAEYSTNAKGQKTEHIFLYKPLLSGKHIAQLY